MSKKKALKTALLILSAVLAAMQQLERSEKTPELEPSEPSPARTLYGDDGYGL